MPITSVMWVMRREPSRRRAAWMMMSTEPTIISRTVRCGRPKPPMAIIDFHSAQAFARLLAWIVPIDSSWPVSWPRQQIEAPPVRDLAYDDSCGLDIAAVSYFYEVAHCDLALSLEVGRTGLETAKT